MVTPTDDRDGSRNDPSWRDPSRPMPPSILPVQRPTPPTQRPTPPTQRPTPPTQRLTPPTQRPTYPAPSAVQANAPENRTPRRIVHRLRAALLITIALLIACAIGFFMWVSAHITTVDALSGAPGTAGDTYLIVGSDSRAGWVGADGTTGARTDTIMVLHKPTSGPTALISIPRDSYVKIPGRDANKINAAYSFGGPPLLVETVEQLTGLTVDHYVEVGFTGVADLVDAVGGVELCYDRDVSDEKSQLEWSAGCHLSDGETSLAFSRMRYSDPLGDIGRTQRQQQLVGAVADEILKPATLLNPFTLVPVARAGLDAFTVSEGTGAFDLARFALAVRSGLGGQAVTGTPPLASINHRVAGVGSTVLLDPDEGEAFWLAIANGSFEPGAEVGGVN